MTTTTTSTTRAMPIIRVWAIGRVPFAFTPVTAATAVTTTARPSQRIQFMRSGVYKMRAVAVPDTVIVSGR